VKKVRAALVIATFASCAQSTAPRAFAASPGDIETGEFTSYEGRLIVKIDWSQVYGFYGGVGYIRVMTEKEVIGVATRFSDSGVSGVVGVEAALGKKVLLYVEASTARIELEQIVTSGAPDGQSICEVCTRHQLDGGR
jgi:hypothetical protein